MLCNLTGRPHTSAKGSIEMQRHSSPLPRESYTKAASAAAKEREQKRLLKPGIVILSASDYQTCNPAEEMIKYFPKSDRSIAAVMQSWKIERCCCIAAREFQSSLASWHTDALLWRQHCGSVYLNLLLRLGWSWGTVELPYS